jgi:putative DNA primase/helicase
MGSTQPSVIAEYIRDAVKNSGGDGLSARLQLMVYPDLVKNWTLIDRPVNQAAKQQATAVFNRLYGLDVQHIGADIDDDGVAYLRFNQAAFDIWANWWTELETRLRSDELHGAMRAHLAKYRKLVPALALIFHLVDEPEAGAVGLKSIAMALAWAEYLESHANRVYASVSTIDGSAAKSLINKIKAQQWTEFKPKDIYDKHWSGLDTPDQVRIVCETLEQYDWIKKTVKQTRGRPSEIYLVNPLMGANHG